MQFSVGWLLCLFLSHAVPRTHNPCMEVLNDVRRRRNTRHMHMWERRQWPCHSGAVWKMSPIARAFRQVEWRIIIHCIAQRGAAAGDAAGAVVAKDWGPCSTAAPSTKHRRRPRSQRQQWRRRWRLHNREYAVSSRRWWMMRMMMMLQWRRWRKCQRWYWTCRRRSEERDDSAASETHVGMCARNVLSFLWTNRSKHTVATI